MKSSIKRTISTFLLLFFVVGQLFADVTASGKVRYGPQIQRTLVTPSDRVRSIAEMSSFRSWVTGRGEGGVLFMATANPGNDNIRSQPISLSYEEHSSDGSRLHVKIGTDTIPVSDLHDWILLPIASYIDSPYINGVTLLGEPYRKDDKEWFRGYADNVLRIAQITQGKTVFWAEYHPALVNTLIGYLMYLVDAYFIGENYLDLNMRGITDELRILQGDNGNVADLERRPHAAESAQKIHDAWSGIIAQENRLAAPQKTMIERELGRGAISEEEAREERSKLDPAVTYIFSDPDEGVTFSITGSKIQFTGIPRYHFLKVVDFEGKPGERKAIYGDADRVTDAIDPKLVRELNPFVFDSITLAAQWSAFFRYVKQENPSGWNNFMQQLEPKTLNPNYDPNIKLDELSRNDEHRISTVYAEENRKYQYIFDTPNYYHETPRSLDFHSKKMDDAYNIFVRIRQNPKLVLTHEQMREYEDLASSDLQEKYLAGFLIILLELINNFEGSKGF